MAREAKAGFTPETSSTSLTDVTLARASLDRAKTVLQRLERELQRQEWCRSRIRNIRRKLEWEVSPECSGEQEAAFWDEVWARESSPFKSRCREDALESPKARQPSPTVGIFPLGSDSSSVHGCRPEAQPDPRLTPPLSRHRTVPSSRCPSTKGSPEPAASSLPTSSVMGNQASLRPPRGFWQEASTHLAASPASPSPLPGNWRSMAWHLEGLRKNSPDDKKLQKLKARILEQQQQQLGSFRDPRDSRTSFSSLLHKQPFKRKVFKATSRSPAPASPGFRAVVSAEIETCLPSEGTEAVERKGLPAAEKESLQEHQSARSSGHRGRAAAQKRPGSWGSPLPGKARKGRGAGLFGASAWREGQRLARKVLGPPVKYPTLRSSTEENKVMFATEPGKTPLATSQMEQSLGKKERAGGPWKSQQATLTKKDNAKQALVRAEPNQKWEAPSRTNGKVMKLQKDPSVEKRAGDGQRPASSKKARANRFSEGLEAGQISDVEKSLTRALLMETGPAASGDRRTSTSLQRRNEASHSPKHKASGRENQAMSCDRLTPGRRHPYSPEELREFMTKQVADREKRTQAEKRSLKEAREARQKRLQEVFQKQKEAFVGKKSCAETRRLNQDAPPAAHAKQNHSQDSLNENPPKADQREWTCQASHALLRNKVKGSSKLYPKMGESTKGTGRSDVIFLSEGGVFSPLKRRDLDISPSLSPLSLPSQRLLVGIETPAPTDPRGPSPCRNKQDRVRAIHNLATDLSERLQREMERLQGRKRPLASGDHGWPPEMPALSERPGLLSKAETPPKDFGGTAGAILNTSHLQSLFVRAQNGLERTSSEEGTAAQAVEDRGTSLPSVAGGGSPLLIEGSSSPQEKQNTVCASSPADAQEGCPAMKSCPVERGLTHPEEPTCSTHKPHPLFLARSTFSNPEAESHFALHQDNGVRHSCEKKDFDLQADHCHDCFDTDPGLQFPAPVNLPSSRMTTAEEAVDRSETADSASQWSEISQFYGGSSTFCHLGLMMAEQNLREEELRARHQRALLRLREKALQEKATAELAWLEHEQCLQGVKGASATAEKQRMLLTNLKQEQAEIRHLQNVFRAAHQERKLLLKQQKELLLVHQSTARLWQQLCMVAGKPLPQEAGSPSSTGGPSVLRKEEAKTTSSLAPSITASSESSRGGSIQGPLQGRGSDNLHVEREEMSSPRAVEKSREWNEWTGIPDIKPREVPTKDRLASRDQAVGPAIKAGSEEIADYLVSQQEEEHPKETSFMKLSKDDIGCISDKGPATNMYLERLDSVLSPAKLHDFSLKVECSPLDSEFHKALAVLIDISGSSLSASDLEAEDTQDTDVSLPEEFVFQEEPHGSHKAFPDAPAVPQILVSEGSPLSFSSSRSQVEVSCEHSNLDDSFCSQEKALEDPVPRTCNSDFVISSNSRKPRPNSPWTGGLLSSEAHPPTNRQNEAFLKVSAPLLCKGSDHEGRVEAEAVWSPSSTVFCCPGNGRQTGTGAAERESDSTSRSHFKIEVQPTKLSHEPSLKNMDLFQDSAFLINDQMPLFPSASSNPSKPESISESRISDAEPAANDCMSRRPDGAAAQDVTVSMGYEEVSVNLLCAKATEGVVKDDQNISATNCQHAKESKMATLHLTSPKPVKLPQVRSCLLKSKEGPAFVSNAPLPPMEDDIQSPVDEVLTYGSADLPSSSEKDASFPSCDLPPAPKDWTEECGNSTFSLKDFPSPPAQLLFPETGELQYPTDEDASIKTNDLPSLSENPMPEELPPLPLALVSSAQQ